MTGFMLGLVLFAVLGPDLAWAKHSHYTFVLPAEYVGWIQIIFGDPQAPRLPYMKNRGYEIDVPESGIARTSDWRVHSDGKDEFYYKSPLPTEKARIVPIPSGAVLPGDSHGGFGVMDTGGKGRGYSWFIFIGDPELRGKVPLADWDKVVASWEETHGNSRVTMPDPYPTPGRMAGRPSLAPSPN